MAPFASGRANLSRVEVSGSRSQTSRVAILIRSTDDEANAVAVRRRTPVRSDAGWGMHALFIGQPADTDDVPSDDDHDPPGRSQRDVGSPGRVSTRPGRRRLESVDQRRGTCRRLDSNDRPNPTAVVVPRQRDNRRPERSRPRCIAGESAYPRPWYRVRCLGRSRVVGSSTASDYRATLWVLELLGVALASAAVGG